MPAALSANLRHRIVLTIGVSLLAFTGNVFALQATGYSAAKNDRFSSGFASAPVANTDPTFVGAGYDFSGTGWSASDPTKGFALLSPKHFLATVHYGGASTLQFQGADGQLYSYAQQSIQGTGYGVVFSGQTTGDISIGTLATPVVPSTTVTPYAVYDLSVAGPVMLYGRGPNGASSPRVGNTTIIGGNTVDTNTSYLVTSRDDVQLEVGDSGSPAFIAWTDPTGAKQLAVIGNNAAIITGTAGNYNVLNFLGRAENVAATNAIMAQDGYVLRFVADATTTWEGGAPGNSTRYATGSNWTTNTAPSGSSYIAFDSTTSAYTTVDLGNQGRDARGIIFNPGTSGFTLNSGTFNLNRGGIANYSEAVQTLNTSFVLTEGQYWDGKDGGLTVTGNVNNQGHLLVVQGAATNRLSGVISGTGGLAKDGSGILAVSGSNTYTGRTFVHNGTLLANNSTGSATGTGTVSVAAGTVAGYGRIAGNITFARGSRLTAGDITSGNLPTLSTVSQASNRLTFGSNVTLDGDFSFYLASHSETVGFTQISLDGPSAVLALGSNSSFVLDDSSFLGIADPNANDAFWTTNHSWTIFDIAGTQAVAGSFGVIDLGTWNQGFFNLITDGGTGNDVILLYTAIPEPSAWALTAGTLVVLMGSAIRRERKRRLSSSIEW